MEENKPSVIENEDLTSKIMRGLRLAHRRMIKYKIKNNQSLVISHNGKIITLKAADFHKLK
jgi:hypothetical protein